GSRRTFLPCRPIQAAIVTGKLLLKDTSARDDTAATILDLVAGTGRQEPRVGRAAPRPRGRVHPLALLRPATRDPRPPPAPPDGRSPGHRRGHNVSGVVHPRVRPERPRHALSRRPPAHPGRPGPLSLRTKPDVSQRQPDRARGSSARPVA